MAETSARSLNVTVVTPGGVAWERTALSVVLETALGQIQVLPGHEPIVTLLEPGEMWIWDGTGETLFAAGEGFAEIGPDRVHVFTDLAENAEAIVLAATEEAKDRAKQILHESAHLTGDEEQAAALLLRECEVKIKIAKLGKVRRHTPERR